MSNRYKRYKYEYYRDVEREYGIKYVVRNREKLKKDFDRFIDGIV